MTYTGARGEPASSGRRLAGSALAGVVCGLVAARWWSVTDSLLLGWTVVAALFVLWCWWSVWPLDATGTERHATREDPGRALSDALLLWVAAASVVSVVVVMFGGRSTSATRTILGILSIASSWAVVHTVHLLRYARQYYTPPVGGLDFHDDRGPAYRDFAYLALTVGTTFQVSDTDVTDSSIRAMVLRHGLMSFGYSTLIIATVINVVASLGS